jgi:hypothetical protein
MRRTLGRSAFWLGLFTWLAGAATAAQADVTYDYMGSDFTNIVPYVCPVGPGTPPPCTPLYTTSDSVTGNVVLANPLPPSSVGGAVYENGGLYIAGAALNSSFSFTDQVVSYSFTDGVNTITNTTPGVNGGPSFITDASGDPVSTTIGDTGTVIGGSSFSAGVSGSQSYNIQVDVGGNQGDRAEYIYREPNDFGDIGFIATSSTPGTWTGPLTTTTPPSGSPTSPTCLSVINNANNLHFTPGIGSIGVTLTGTSASMMPYDINAAFTPDMGATLIQASEDCGVSNFDWQQTVDVLPPPGNGLAAASNPTVPLTAPIPSTFLDPPLGGYVAVSNGAPHMLYCDHTPYFQSPIGPPTPSDPIIYIKYDPSTAAPYPFYYQPNGPSGDCQSLQANEPSSTMLTFFDSPNDGNLTNNEFLEFTTCLVGVGVFGNPVDTNLVPLPASSNDCFNWEDTFTGPDVICPHSLGSLLYCEIVGPVGSGGIPNLDNAISSGYPDLGIGGITLTSQPVPEPSTILLLLPGIGASAFMVKRRRKAHGPKSGRRGS